MRLREMTAEEYAEYRPTLVREYAAEQVWIGRFSAQDAEAEVDRELAELLPDGPATAGQPLLVAEDDEGRVGVLWLSLTHPRGVPDTGWIQDIQVVEHRRGQRLGRELLAAAEEEIRRHGLKSLALNVFGHNSVARSLYTSAGYQTTNVIMRKYLP